MKSEDAPRCPECGGTSFTIDEHAQTERTIAPTFYVVGRSELAVTLVTVAVAFCNDCEFCVELHR